MAASWKISRAADALFHLVRKSVWVVSKAEMAWGIGSALRTRATCLSKTLEERVKCPL
jgi:hypothetical protein